MKKTLELYPFFLILLPAFVIIHLEKELHRLINYNLIFDKIIFLFLTPLVFFILFYLLLRSIRKSAVMTLAFQIFFYFTGELKTWLLLKFPGSIWESYSFLIPVLLLILVIVFLRLRKSGSGMYQTFFYINIALVIFIMADLVQLFIAGDKGKYKIVSSQEQNYTICDTCSSPDIYYIISDAYTSTKNLAKYYDYSNKPFEENLRNKGFVIIPDSRSNYVYTAFSVGSILNMDYIENVDTTGKTLDRAYLQALKLVYHNRLFQFLKKENYLILNHSIFDFDSHPSTIRNIDFWDIRRTLDQYNLLFKLNYDIGYHLPLKAKKFMNRNAFNVKWSENTKRHDLTVYQHLVQSAKLKSSQPKFVYAHFLRPHPPFLHDSLGNVLMEDVEEKKGYVHQVAYINQMLKKITDSILTYAQRPLAIIIQGDHGYSYEQSIRKSTMFSNFHTIFYSNKDNSLINDSITNVNTFRILLNTFFKSDMKILPDRFYFQPH